jgi:hypothetical protein
MNIMVIRVMLFPSMLALVAGIMLAGALASLSSGARSGA